MNLAEEIKARVTMDDVLAAYGLPTSRQKRIPCPLHHGENKNFAYDNKFFRCFVCGEKGTVIDFVMKLHGIGFREAVVRLNEDLGLNLTTVKENYSPSRERSRILAEREEKARKKDELLKRLNEKTLERRNLYFITETHHPTEEGSELDELIYALSTIPRLDYEIEEMMQEWLEMR